VGSARPNTERARIVVATTRNRLQKDVGQEELGWQKKGGQKKHCIFSAPCFPPAFFGDTTIGSIAAAGRRVLDLLVPRDEPIRLALPFDQCTRRRAGKWE
jgi:hypothetical protein